MIYRLFYAQGSASDGVRVILEEIGAHYELIQSTKDRSKSRPPQQLKINPNGWLPVLIFGNNGMYECAAITMFLCDLHPEVNLAPKYNDPKGDYIYRLWYTFPAPYRLPFKLTIIPIILSIKWLMNPAPKDKG